MIPQANQIYRHFKGNLYRVITVAKHTETEEDLVIYQALYGDFQVYARPLQMFASEVDREKYPDVIQKKRFELVEQMVTTPISMERGEEVLSEQEKTESFPEQQEKTVSDSKQIWPVKEEEENTEACDAPEEVLVDLDPMVEQYLDTDSYREKLNILHGLRHRITEHMLDTMAIVIDFELPEGDVQKKYDALNDCLLTKEKYECNRIW